MKSAALVSLTALAAALCMYAVCQWLRVDPDINGSGQTVSAISGIALVSGLICFYWPLVLGEYTVGMAVGIAIGILADAFWPIGSDADSNLWPIAIVLWWVLAFFGGLLGTSIARHVRKRIDRLNRK